MWKKINHVAIVLSYEFSFFFTHCKSQISNSLFLAFSLRFQAFEEEDDIHTHFSLLHSQGFEEKISDDRSINKEKKMEIKIEVRRNNTKI